MKRRTLLLILFWVVLVLAGTSHSYPDGWYWNLPGGHWCGVEVAPTPGAFCDVD